MTRKFSEISLEGRIGLYDLIESKIQAFNSRLNSNEKHLGDQFANELSSHFPIERFRKLDNVTKEIFKLIKNHPQVEMDDITDSLWQDVGQKYLALYETIQNFNESRPGVNEITNTNEWRIFLEQGLRQVHQFDRHNQSSGNYEKLLDVETRSYTLLSLIKSSIIDSKGAPESLEITDSLKEAKGIADTLMKNKGLIESGIQSAESINKFNVANIDDALKNVGEMFYNKDAYLDFSIAELTFRGLFKKMRDGTFRIIFITLNDFFESPKWWLLWGVIPLSILLFAILSEYSAILDGNSEVLQKYKDFWPIIASLHLIGASFLGYITVFCLSNFKKLEQRHEAYRFRGVLTRSFGFLLRTADEEQKKILYPKALDAIFKDLPETNTGQDVNINLPVTEIMKGISGKV